MLRFLRRLLWGDSPREPLRLMPDLGSAVELVPPKQYMVQLTCPRCGNTILTLMTEAEIDSIRLDS